MMAPGGCNGGAIVLIIATGEAVGAICLHERLVVDGLVGLDAFVNQPID
jgi:hypothetical protein